MLLLRSRFLTDEKYICYVRRSTNNYSFCHFIERGYIWVILLNLLHTGNLQFLAIFHNLAANEHGFLPKISKISIYTPKNQFFFIFFDFPCFFLIYLANLDCGPLRKHHNGPQSKLAE